MKPLMLSWQVPPLWQGLPAHSSMLMLHMLPAGGRGRGVGVQLSHSGEKDEGSRGPGASPSEPQCPALLQADNNQPLNRVLPRRTAGERGHLTRQGQGHEHSSGRPGPAPTQGTLPAAPVAEPALDTGCPGRPGHSQGQTGCAGAWLCSRPAGPVAGNRDEGLEDAHACWSPALPWSLPQSAEAGSLRAGPWAGASTIPPSGSARPEPSRGPC